MNYNKLRRDLIEYYGSAAYSGSPMAFATLINIENASQRELVQLAKEAGFNLRDYES